MSHGKPTPPPRRSSMRPLFKILIVGLPLLLVASCFAGVIGVIGAVVGSSSTEATPTLSDIATAASAPTTPTPTPSPRPTIDAQRGSVLAAVYDLKVVTDSAADDDADFDRDQFGPAWKDVDRNGCDQRNDVLRRDLTKPHTKPGTNGCVLASGVLKSEYTGKTVKFARGDGKIDIDHVVLPGRGMAFRSVKKASIPGGRVGVAAVNPSSKQPCRGSRTE